MTFTRSLAVLAVLALVALLTYGVASKNPNRSFEEALDSGARLAAPDRPLPKLSGSGTLSLEELRGNYVVVNFWASWCDPCREESPALERFYKSHRKDNVVVFGIDSLDVSDDAKRFVRRYHLSYPIVRDKQGERRQAWGLTGFPETFIVDREGKVAWLSRGPVTEKQLNKALHGVQEADRE